MRKSLAMALCASTCIVAVSQLAYAAAPASVPTVPDGLSGVVKSAKGPEAGVWVIAETHDLPTRFIQIVVTDDQGRYVLPQLPKANYDVWVRGYGLVDSKAVKSEPGKVVNLTAVVAPDAKAAAEYYPADYWYALIKMPDKSEFPGTGPKGNGIAPLMKNQDNWVINLKDGCVLCHNVGDKATREIAEVSNNPEGWAERITKAREYGDQALGNIGAGEAASMGNAMTRYGRVRGLSMFADWTQRIAKGELPKEAPPRPVGMERNLVLTMWDWGGGRYNHDQISTYRHDPTMNANGPVYGGALATGYLEYLDPVTNKPSEIPIPSLSGDQEHDIYAFPRGPMMDKDGRIWLTDASRNNQAVSMKAHGTPANGPILGMRADYCSNGAANKFAKYYPMTGQNTSQIDVFDPKDKKITVLPSCFSVHHQMPTEDIMFFSGDTNVMGWIDLKTWTQTRDPEKSEGWCPMVLDTNGDGKITPDRTQWNGPGEGKTQAVTEEGGGGGAITNVDAKKDTRISGFLYGMDVNMKDNTAWFAKTSPSYPAGIIRFDRGAAPPETCKSEYYEPPKKPDGTYQAYLGRSVSMDTKGIAWLAFNSGQMGSFDRSKCKVLSGPSATGQQCPEGWTFHEIPGPKFAGTNISSDMYYTNWVDQFDTLGLGKDVPLANGSNSDLLVAYLPEKDQVIKLRVPYPMGFHSRGMDGRIDDPKTGWKGRGLWGTFGAAAVWHQEGGEEGYGPELVKMQMRPDPLAY